MNELCYTKILEVVMTTKERVLSEIDKLTEDQLEELYKIVCHFLQEKPAKNSGFLATLSQIQIDGPEDFAANLDLYLSGEK
jgi:hypothetical protein